MERIDNGVGDLILNGEHVLELAVVPFRPEVVTIGCVAELCRHSDAVPGFSHATLEHILHVERLPDGPEIGLAILEHKRRCARGHPQSLYTAQQTQQLLREAVPEVLVFRVSAQVRKGKNSDRPHRRLHRASYYQPGSLTGAQPSAWTKPNIVA